MFHKEDFKIGGVVKICPVQATAWNLIENIRTRFGKDFNTETLSAQKSAEEMGPYIAVTIVTSIKEYRRTDHTCVTCITVTNQQPPWSSCLIAELPILQVSSDW